MFVKSIVNRQFLNVLRTSLINHKQILIISFVSIKFQVHCTCRSVSRWRNFVPHNSLLWFYIGNRICPTFDCDGCCTLHKKISEIRRHFGWFTYAESNELQSATLSILPTKVNLLSGIVNWVFNNYFFFILKQKTFLQTMLVMYGFYSENSFLKKPLIFSNFVLL